MLQMIAALLLDRRSLTGVRDDSIRLLFRWLGARERVKPAPWLPTPAAYANCHPECQWGVSLSL